MIRGREYLTNTKFHDSCAILYIVLIGKYINPAPKEIEIMCKYK